MSILEDKYCEKCLSSWMKYLVESTEVSGLMLLHGAPFDGFCEECKGKHSKLDEVLIIRELSQSLVESALRAVCDDNTKS